MPEEEQIRSVIVAGVAGAGKTTVGKVLAECLGWEFQDADDLHPPENVRKMSRGIPLTDEDRWPWLQKVRDFQDRAHAAGCGTVVACSALRRSYARFLTEGRPHVRLAVLQVDPEVLTQRLAERPDHFFPPELLASQLANQELSPADDLFDGSEPVAKVAEMIIQRFGLES